jgi:signal transduction histidine kinase/CheY-like chemotaxis protein
LVDAQDAAAAIIESLRAELDDARQQLAAATHQVDLERDKLETAMRERELLISSLEFERRRLGALLEKAPAFIGVVRGPHHVIESANDAFHDVSGWRPLLGRTIGDAFPEFAGQGFLERLDRVYQSGEPFAARGLPGKLVRRAGDPPAQRYANLMLQPLVEADGTVTGVFIHGVDVTDETIAEHRLREQFNHVPMPTHVWQRVERNGVRQFVLVDFNAAELELSRGRIAEHLGEPASEFFSKNPIVIEDLERCLDGNLRIQREIERVMITTGETRRLFVSYGAAPPDRVIVHTEDVTERRQLELQLRQSQKMEAVGRLAGGVAHDFNNILSVILGYIELHLEELKPEDPFRIDVEEMHKAVLRAVALTRQLLAFSRKQILQPRVVDLNRTLNSLATMLRRLLGEDIELSLATAPDAYGVYADPGQLEQVIVNLAINARDAMPTGGKLTVETANVQLDDAFAANHLGVVPGPYLMVSVSDTGVGMDEATRAQIFEPFFTTKGPDKGTGLGLAMVFAIVDQSGGTIWVYSEPDRGSTFKIYLPRATRTSEAVPAVSSSPAGGSETILLVEDDEPVRVLVRTILRRNGYRVLEASNGGEALLISDQFASTIHLLLSDVIMPRMSGSQIAERLTAQRKDMKVLFMSGYTDDAIVIHGILERGVAFLQKPVSSDALLRKLREVLDGVDTTRAVATRSG